MPENPLFYFKPLLTRGAVAILGYTRHCPNRRCRRRQSCCDISRRDPHCLPLLAPVQSRRLADLVQLAADILVGFYPPLPPGNPWRTELPDEVFALLARCIADLPWHRGYLGGWCDRYRGVSKAVVPTVPPPEPTAPPAARIDTAALLREMKAELDYARRIADIYDC